MKLSDKLPRGIRRLLRLPRELRATNARPRRRDSLSHRDACRAAARERHVGGRRRGRGDRTRFGDTTTAILLRRHRRAESRRDKFARLDDSDRTCVRRPTDRPLAAVHRDCHTDSCAWHRREYRRLQPRQSPADLAPPVCRREPDGGILATSGGGEIAIHPSPEMIDTWRARAKTVQDVVVFEDTTFTLGDSTRGATRQR